MRPVLTLTRDDISPALARLAATAKHPRAVFLAMGNVFKSITVGNFSSGGMKFRPLPWPAKKDGTPATLKKTGLLFHSFNLEVTDQFARLSNPTPYAAVHQFGSEHSDEEGAKSAAAENARRGGAGAHVSHVAQNIPARPFFPVLNGQLTPEAEQMIGDAGRRAIERQAD